MSLLSLNRERDRLPWLAVGLWLAATAGLLALRPLLPLDETRAVAVAWEMRVGGDWLVPHLNWEPYPEKPPLLAWLVNAAWALFGVSETAARLVVPGLGLLAILLTRAVARRLAPGRPAAWRAAPVVLVGMPLWTWWGSLAVYDLPLATCVLAAHAAGLAFAVGGSISWMAAAGVALGAGALFKGPVVLAHVFPAWLAWAWWCPQGGQAAARWWIGVGLALVLVAATGLGWALAAAAAGGEAYAARLLGQTADRLGAGATHVKPWWYYAPLLAIVTLPWVLRAGAWPGRPAPVGAGRRPAGAPSAGRYLAAWTGGAVLVLSLAGGKQPHYLLPLLPPLAIGTALGLTNAGRPYRRAEAWLPAAALAAAAVVIAAGPTYCAARPAAAVCAALDPRWAAVPLLLAAFVAAGARVPRLRGPTVLAAATVAFVVALTAWAGPVLDRERTAEMAAAIAEVQSRGRRVAQLGRYQGQFDFAGRLRKPIEWFEEPADLAAWAEAHPRGYILVYTPERPGPHAASAVLSVPYRGHYAILWQAGEARDHGVLASPSRPGDWSTEHATS